MKVRPINFLCLESSLKNLSRRQNPKTISQRKRLKLREIYDLSVNNLDYQLAQSKRKNKILTKNFMETKLSTKRDFQEGNTPTNLPPAKTLILQNQG